MIKKEVINMKSKSSHIASEIIEGLEAFKKHKKGKITLRTYEVKNKPAPDASPEIIRSTREKFHMSRGVFARKLKISPRSLERWEQGISKPNHQASVLILLTRKYPDVLDKIDSL